MTDICTIEQLYKDLPKLENSLDFMKLNNGDYVCAEQVLTLLSTKIVELTNKNIELEKRIKELER